MYYPRSENNKTIKLLKFCAFSFAYALLGFSWCGSYGLVVMYVKKQSLQHIESLLRAWKCCRCVVI